MVVVAVVVVVVVVVVVGVLAAILVVSFLRPAGNCLVRHNPARNPIRNRNPKPSSAHERISLHQQEPRHISCIRDDHSHTVA